MLSFKNENKKCDTGFSIETSLKRKTYLIKTISLLIAMIFLFQQIVWAGDLGTLLDDDQTMTEVSPDELESLNTVKNDLISSKNLIESFVASSESEEIKSIIMPVSAESEIDYTDIIDSFGRVTKRTFSTGEYITYEYYGETQNKYKEKHHDDQGHSYLYIQYWEEYPNVKRYEKKDDPDLGSEGDILECSYDKYEGVVKRVFDNGNFFTTEYWFPGLQQK